MGPGRPPRAGHLLWETRCRQNENAHHFSLSILSCSWASPDALAVSLLARGQQAGRGASHVGLWGSCPSPASVFCSQCRPGHRALSTALPGRDAQGKRARLCASDKTSVTLCEQSGCFSQTFSHSGVCVGANLGTQRAARHAAGLCPRPGSWATTGGTTSSRAWFSRSSGGSSEGLRSRSPKPGRWRPHSL